MYQPPQPPLAPQTPQIEARRYTANSHSPESQALLYHAAILQEQARADDPAYGQAYLQLLREAFQEWFDAKIQQALIQVTQGDVGRGKSKKTRRGSRKNKQAHPANSSTIRAPRWADATSWNPKIDVPHEAATGTGVFIPGAPSAGPAQPEPSPASLLGSLLTNQLLSASPRAQTMPQQLMPTSPCLFGMQSPLLPAHNLTTPALSAASLASTASDLSLDLPPAASVTSLAATSSLVLGNDVGSPYVQNKSKDRHSALQTHGGVAGLAKALHTDLERGLAVPAHSPHNVQHDELLDVAWDAHEIPLAARQAAFGINALPIVPPKTLFELWSGNLLDPIILLLIVAATVSTVAGIMVAEERQQRAWLEGVAIWVAVAVVTMVAAWNDWRKDQQFAVLNRQRAVVHVKVVRDGMEQLVASPHIIVGDVVLLDTGDKVAADGILITASDLLIDESALTGEADPVHKRVGPGSDCWCRAGTSVAEGSGRLLVVAVGPNSEWGKTMTLVAVEAEDTPLQCKLAALAGLIGKIGAGVALACFVVLTIRWIVQQRGFPLDKLSSGPLRFFMFAVTIVVVAVPEGLPLAVTISLGYSMQLMMKDNIFVRALAACETMGEVTAICSDKTGTLTENRMTVVEGWFAGAFFPSTPPALDIPERVRMEMKLNAALNSKAFLRDHPDGTLELGGNRTECALLLLLRHWGYNYTTLRSTYSPHILKVYGFTSARKMASVLVDHSSTHHSSTTHSPTTHSSTNQLSTLHLYCKGAAEMVLSRCTSVLDANGTQQLMTPEVNAALQSVIVGMAGRGLRTIAFALRMFPAGTNAAGLLGTDNQGMGDQEGVCVEEDMVLIGLVGIKDPVRQEVPTAVTACQEAGICVRMVTGDNIHTAQHIARQCGILTATGQAMEGPAFRALTGPHLTSCLDGLQVLARSSPTDKHTLVNALKAQGHVVAVTGDGTNDAPALQAADVGLAMGITGTDVAKEAADIIIMDDNFASITKAVIWGRSVFASIRKFLQFQMTVNVVALTVSFVAAMVDGQMPLNVMQLLWVNLIMDALGALALATEKPSPALLEQRPTGRHEPLITPVMWKHIITQAVYQLVCLLLVYSAFQVDGDDAQCTAYASSTISYPVYGSDTSSLLSMCCGEDVPCDQGQGGPYLSNEKPMCLFTDDDLDECTLTPPILDAICNTTSLPACPRFVALQTAYTQAQKLWTQQRSRTLLEANTMVFNAFIFMQIFNMINARKLHDELNVFAGSTQGSLFWSLIALMIFCQLIIVQALAPAFKILPQSPSQWMLAVVLGAASLLVSLVVKVVSRQVWVKAAWSWLMDKVSSLGNAFLWVQRGRWQPLKDAPGASQQIGQRTSQQAFLDAIPAAQPLPVSHGGAVRTLQHSKSTLSQRSALQSSPSSKQWSCWTTLTSSPTATGPADQALLSRQLSSLSRQESVPGVQHVEHTVELCAVPRGSSDYDLR